MLLGDTCGFFFCHLSLLHDGALAGVAWQHPPRRCYCRGLIHGNILHDGYCVGGINMNGNKINITRTSLMITYYYQYISGVRVFDLE